MQSAMASETKTEENPNPADHVLDLLKSARPIVTDFAFNSLCVSLYGYGCGLSANRGLIGSLATAGFATKAYAVSSGFYCLFDAILTNVRGKQDIINASVAGHCMGFFSSFFLGTNRLLNIATGGLVATLDFGVNSTLKKAMLASPTSPSSSRYKDIQSTCSLCRGGPNITCIKEVAKDIIIVALLGSTIGLAFGLAAKIGFPSSLRIAGYGAKIGAIGRGAYIFSFLLLRELRGKDNVTNAGLAGCVAGLFLAHTDAGGMNALVSECLKGGAFSAFLEGILNCRPIFPRLPPMRNKLCAAGVLPPFTLPLHKNIDDGF